MEILYIAVHPYSTFETWALPRLTLPVLAKKNKNKNKKAIGLDQQNKSLHFFGYFFAVVARPMREHVRELS